MRTEWVEVPHVDLQVTHTSPFDVRIRILTLRVLSFKGVWFDNPVGFRKNHLGLTPLPDWRAA